MNKTTDRNIKKATQLKHIKEKLHLLKDKKSKKYEEGVSCPNCHDYLKPSQKERFRMRQKQISLAKKLGKKHIFQKEF